MSNGDDKSFSFVHASISDDQRAYMEAKKAEYKAKMSANKKEKIKEDTSQTENNTDDKTLFSHENLDTPPANESKEDDYMVDETFYVGGVVKVENKESDKLLKSNIKKRDKDFNLNESLKVKISLNVKDMQLLKFYLFMENISMTTFVNELIKNKVKQISKTMDSNLRTLLYNNTRNKKK